jgi:RNA polymerase-binding transcription factor DksA
MNLAKDGAMDIERYRSQLKAIQRQLDTRLQRETDQARAVEEDQADPSDTAQVDELRDEYLILAQANSATLTQVVEALARIDAGTFGRCAVDGEPIDERRLKSVPWTPYCVKHQEEIEAAQGLKTPSL